MAEGDDIVGPARHQGGEASRRRRGRAGSRPVTEGDPRESFAERGYAGPVPLFSQAECEDILARLRRSEERPPLDWHKGRAVSSLEYYALARHDRILDLVTDLIGRDVVLWGASLVVRSPGQAHAWHTDVEAWSPTAETVAVWIGLANTTAASSLTVAPYSHRFGTTLQQAADEKGADRSALGDAEVASWARERDDRSGVLLIESADGEALFFDGRIWHGSHNLDWHGKRYAALLQYAAVGTAVRIPRRVAWPFDWHQTPRPPCIVVSGRDVPGSNRLVRGPTATAGRSLPDVSSRIHPLQLPLERDPEVGWKPHSLFRGATPDIREMRCHASVLDPDRSPHPPHQHDDEEILVVLDGEADLIWVDGDTAPATHRVERGTFAYYPAGFKHTMRNSSSEPATYLMFRWSTDRKERGDFLEPRLVPFAESYAAMRHHPPTGFPARRVLDGETRYLRKLHAHITTLQPGRGYCPHVDSYDVGIVVLEGTVETLGERVGPHGVIFYAAGEPHGMQNIGEGPAVYLVFEFHGRHSPSYASRDRRLTRRVWRVARDPREWKGAVTRSARSIVRSLGRRLRRT